MEKHAVRSRTGFFLLIIFFFSRLEKSTGALLCVPKKTHSSHLVGKISVCEGTLGCTGISVGLLLRGSPKESDGVVPMMGL